MSTELQVTGRADLLGRLRQLLRVKDPAVAAGMGSGDTSPVVNETNLQTVVRGLLALVQAEDGAQSKLAALGLCEVYYCNVSFTCWSCWCCGRAPRTILCVGVRVERLIVLGGSDCSKR